VERRALRASGLALAILSFQTLGIVYSFLFYLPSIHDVRDLGIIYSDIGTSPLYVLNGIWPASGPVPPKEDVIGGLSAIIWSLTLIPLLKYVRATLLPSLCKRTTLRNAIRSLSVCDLARTKVRAAVFYDSLRINS
jgi:KUP system potassium uptake protein